MLEYSRGLCHFQQNLFSSHMYQIRLEVCANSNLQTRVISSDYSVYALGRGGGVAWEQTSKAGPVVEGIKPNDKFSTF